MPSLKVHCKISLSRTKKDFKELHEWIDAPQKDLGNNHRIERHSFHDAYLKYIEERWGEAGVIEWLFHIAVDNLETAHMWSVNHYTKPYDEILVNFKGKEIDTMIFTRDSLVTNWTKRYTKEYSKKEIKK